MRIATRCNTLIERTSPWQLAKQKENNQQLDGVLYHLAESLRIIAILISPVMPQSAHGIFDQLNWKMELSGQEERFCSQTRIGGDCRTDTSSANRCHYSPDRILISGESIPRLRSP